MRNKKVLFAVQAAMIAALYVVLTYITNLLGLASGTSVLCSQYLGAKLEKNMIQVVGVALLLNLVVGLAVSAILHFGATTLLGWMGLRPELLQYGIGYMEIVGAFF